MPLYVKTSLLRKYQYYIINAFRCHKFKLRTDLIDVGLYIFKYWLLKLLLELESEYDLSMSSIHVCLTLHFIVNIGRIYSIFGKTII